MKGFGQFIAIVRWDLRRELRRPETALNMTLFATLILFVGQIGITVFAGQFVDSADVPAELRGDAVLRASRTLGPTFYWVAALFAGTVGLQQAFAAERDSRSILGWMVAPVDWGTVYLARVASTWILVVAMQIVLLGVYVVLFNPPPGAGWIQLLIAVGAFSFAYVAPGVILSAMTTMLGGAGEVVLRILVFVLMIPLIMLTLDVSPQLFGLSDGRFVARTFALGDFSPLDYISVAFAIGVIYLTVGFVLFPKVLEE